METVIKKTNKATLIAAALIITGATAIFSTYAASDEPVPTDRPGPFACFEQMNSLSDEEKAKMQEAHDLMQAGDHEGAKIILDELGIKPPKRFGHHRAEFMKNLTEEQKAKLQKAKELMKAGDKEGAKAIFDELGLKGPVSRHDKGFGTWEKKGVDPNTGVTE